jgi:hypothetical protein
VTVELHAPMSQRKQAFDPEPIVGLFELLIDSGGDESTTRQCLGILTGKIQSRDGIELSHFHQSDVEVANTFGYRSKAFLRASGGLLRSRAAFLEGFAGGPRGLIREVLVLIHWFFSGCLG